MLITGTSCEREPLSQPCSVSLKKVKIETDLTEIRLLRDISQGNSTAFWELWKQHQDYLYSRCLTWMGGSYIEAEEAFSRATIKAWEKLPNYAEKITNPKAWLTRFFHNFCMDMHREKQTRGIGIESIEEIEVAGKEAVASSLDSPELVVLRNELGVYIRRALEALPPQLQEPFILRFYQEMSYPEIAQQLALSQDNVYKRIQQAREILQKRLNNYFYGLDEYFLDYSSLEEDYTYQREESRQESFLSEETMLSNSETLMNAGYITEPINYQVTATCLHTIQHTWYRFPTPLAWR